MESVSIARTILVIVAYAIDVFIGLALLGVIIWILGKIPSIPNTWYPDNFDINSTKEQRRACWESMTENEKEIARKERAATILGLIVILGVYVFAVYLSVKIIFPAVIEMAKTM